MFAKEQESWITMEDVYRSINRITKTDACTKAYHEPTYDTISEVATEEVMRYPTREVRNKIHMTNPITALISENNTMVVNTIEIKGIHTPTVLQSK